jgi:hypothetical protein
LTWIPLNIANIPSITYVQCAQHLVCSLTFAPIETHTLISLAFWKIRFFLQFILLADLAIVWKFLEPHWDPRQDATEQRWFKNLQGFCDFSARVATQDSGIIAELILFPNMHFVLRYNYRTLLCCFNSYSIFVLSLVDFR